MTENQRQAAVPDMALLYMKSRCSAILQIWKGVTQDYLGKVTRLIANREANKE